MSRGTRNDEIGRKWCGTVADILARCEADEGEARMALRQVEEWLRVIAEGADPSEVIFGGKPAATDRYASAITRIVQARINAGMTQGEAIRSVAAADGEKPSRIKQIYLRHRSAIDQEDPLDTR